MTYVLAEAAWSVFVQNKADSSKTAVRTSEIEAVVQRSESESIIVTGGDTYVVEVSFDEALRIVLSEGAHLIPLHAPE